MAFYPNVIFSAFVAPLPLEHSICKKTQSIFINCSL